MIRHYEAHPVFEPQDGGKFQIWAALAAGLIAGLILLLVPRGSPWAGVSFFSQVIMGRALAPGMVMPLPVVCLLHLGIAEVYSLIVSLFVNNVTQTRALLVGGVIGAVLYVCNLAVVRIAFPGWDGNGVAVLFTHIVFGLIVSGAYRGLLKRRQMAEVVR